MQTHWIHLFGQTVLRRTSSFVALLTVLMMIPLFPVNGMSQVQPICSLTVKVVNPQNAEVEAEIQVVESNGRTTILENELGGARFCDLGLLPVTITVGKSACNQVVLRDVPLDWPGTKTVNVIYDIEPCFVTRVPSKFCDVMIRVLDVGDRPLQEAKIHVSGSDKPPAKTDEFGRGFVPIATGAGIIEIEHDGFVTGKLVINCDLKSPKQEQVIRLRAIP
jgi:hypothetical protein